MLSADNVELYIGDTIYIVYDGSQLKVNIVDDFDGKKVIYRNYDGDTKHSAKISCCYYNPNNALKRLLELQNDEYENIY